jgi:hypothetical protein
VLANASIAREAEFLLGACVIALAAPLPLLLFTKMSAHRIYIAQLLVAILASVFGSLPWARRSLVPKRPSEPPAIARRWRSSSFAASTGRSAACSSMSKKKLRSICHAAIGASRTS